MSRIRVTLALLALLAPLAPASSAFAEAGIADEDAYTRSGLYFGIGASFIEQLWDNDLSSVVGGNVDIDYGVAINTEIGWRFNPYFAAELNYEGVKGYDVTVRSGPDFRVDSHSLTANTRLYYPLERWQPYVLLGVGMSHFDIHKNSNYSTRGGTIDVAGRLGAGLDFYLTENIVLNAAFTSLLTGFEFNTPRGKADGIYYLSTTLGAAYRF